MIKYQVRISSSPFRKMRDMWTAPKARKEVLGIVGALLDRKAKAGARSVIGGSFGDQIALSVSHRVTEKTVIVGATHFAAAHKQNGGEIRAPGKGKGSTGAKMLAIPIDPSAKGKSPREINGLFLVVDKGAGAAGRAFLARGDAFGGLQYMFVLKKSVTQKAYPWFPKEREAEKVVDQAISTWIKRRAQS